MMLLFNLDKMFSWENKIRQTADIYSKLFAVLGLVFEKTFEQHNVSLRYVTQKSTWNALQYDSVTFAAHCMLGKSQY